jgi:long-chain fatty acid transport protein
MNRRLALILIAGLPAMATNGYFEYGYGTLHKGLAGAGAALSLSSLSTATNPAAAAFLGTEAEVDVAYFNPNRSYEVQGNPSGYPGTFPLAPGKVDSSSTAFLVPSLGAFAPFSSSPSNLSNNGNATSTGYGLRAGYSSSSQPIPSSQVLFNILAPAVIKQHVSVGATRTLNADWKGSISVTRALANSVTGPNPLEAPGRQTLTLSMDPWDLEAGVTVRF